MDGNEKAIGRRGLLQLLPVALLSRTVLAEGAHCGASSSTAAQTGPYQFRFFTKEEAGLVEGWMEALIPADDHSPGAREARVIEFADLMVADSPSYVQEDWRNGIQLVRAAVTETTLERWMEAASEHEQDPQSVADLFFQTLKHMTINGYYSSAIGIHQDMQYQGNTYVAEFKGCDHAEHKG